MKSLKAGRTSNRRTGGNDVATIALRTNGVSDGVSCSDRLTAGEATDKLRCIRGLRQASMAERGVSGGPRCLVFAKANGVFYWQTERMDLGISET